MITSEPILCMKDGYASRSENVKNNLFFNLARLFIISVSKGKPVNHLAITSISRFSSHITV